MDFLFNNRSIMLKISMNAMAVQNYFLGLRTKRVESENGTLLLSLRRLPNCLSICPSVCHQAVFQERRVEFLTIASPTRTSYSIKFYRRQTFRSVLSTEIMTTERLEPLFIY